MNRTFHRLRLTCGMVLFAILVGLPYLRIHGESALRFDIFSLRLFFFGTSIWLADFFIVLVAVIFLTFLTLFATTLFGRVWCGWLCPQTVLVDATLFIERAQGKRYATVIISWMAGVLVSAVVAASILGYLVSPYDLPFLLRTDGFQARLIVVSFSVLTVLLLLDVLVLRRQFCATVCPYAKMQGVLFDDRTLVVAFDQERADECLQCGACLKACPVNVDIRKGPNMACIHCAECVDACIKRTAVMNRRSLVNYTFGSAPKHGAGVRTNPLITGTLTVLALAFLVYLSASRMPFDMNVQLSYSETPTTGEGGITTSYIISLRNTETTDLILDLSAAAVSGVVRITPDTIVLHRGSGLLKMPVSINLTNVPVSDQPITITLTARSKQLEKSVTRTIYFMVPKSK